MPQQPRPWAGHEKSLQRHVLELRGSSTFLGSAAPYQKIDYNPGSGVKCKCCRFFATGHMSSVRLPISSESIELLLNARKAASVCGKSLRTWRTWDAAGL